MDAVSVVNRVALGDILRRSARRFPDKAALVDGQTRVTYRELDERTNQFAHYLLSSGLSPGDRVATICQNSHLFVMAYSGIQKAGMVWVPINPGLGPEDLRYILEHSEARVAVADDLILADPRRREAIAGNVERLLVIPYEGLDPGGAGISFESTLDGQPGKEPDVDIADRDLAQIMYTSGTTGRPKGVMHSHLSVFVATLSNLVEMDVRRDDVATAMMPLFHCAQHVMTTGFLHIGTTNVIIRRFDPVGFMEAVQRERITWVFALPMMYRALLDHPERKRFDLSSLRYCLYAMAPMDERTLRRAIGELCPNFALGTGQTEIYPGTMIFAPEEQLRRFGPYWGASTIINDTAVMDDEGRILGPGQVGEVVHRGPNVMMGYYKQPDATEESRKFGWHHTGDLGMWDPDGQLIFVDRKKDMVKTGGENVPSIKVEAVLLAHPGVANAAVVGLPHPKWAEAVTAFVVRKPGSQVTEEALLAHCREHLGGFEVPKVIRLVDQLPLTTTGKVQKHVLREQYRDLYAEGPSHGQG
ncbi:AMP-binding protein [Kyrpidia sp.]|uniref:AMP-binding protein n=1 Tax=Kyrpidia sp. TaxID=2073077 RepID=UPI0025864854|nr:AMP-binding protein [Kyrpidia sp.]MCL6574554.1 AMP-binding protein [Kyrpidia sp.]